MLDAYGPGGVRPAPLSGGTLNSVWRVDGLDGTFVPKRYDEKPPAEVKQSLVVQEAALARGLPVPGVVPNARGVAVMEDGGKAYVLSRFIEGKLYLPGKIPALAARHMGEVLGKLHTAISELAPGRVASLPTPAEIDALLRSLLASARERRSDPVDAIAEGVLEAKLDLLSSVRGVPPLVLQWTHGDYEWRNVLFDTKDEVAGVIDFDEAAFYHPARDVMRCIALSFPNLEPEADDYFGGYAAVRGTSPQEARSFVEFYRYIATFRVWPIMARYRQPESYRPAWDGLIQPFVAWDWEGLSDRLATVADLVGAGPSTLS